ncbi:uncharacterized protein LOC9657615 [Selaginella moellendorffii]|uniref:uncharacterized protein LOC9657615 n=1 Tax=Selaginella moellendorffii TaxID=88036 RepID=UPI000D1CADFD|nr:uncharacterized protein LOC9657615 [Selaginella moellendorffii]|eukprot:XP_002980847.2 uncharacterized protein LOC9657615 [Selaginella moellendorffii]
MEALSSFKPICNRAQGQIDPLLAAHCNSTAFLFSINPSRYEDLHVVVSDFHSNTWRASFDYDYLENLRNELGIRDSFPVYMQNLHDGFSSNQVKFELSAAAPSRAAASGRLKTRISLREISLELELSEGRCASDNMSTLIWEFFEILSAAKSRVFHLEAALAEGKIKTLKVLDTVECIRAKQRAMAINVSPLNPSRKQPKPVLQAAPSTVKFPSNSSDGSFFLGEAPCSPDLKLEETYCAGGDEMSASTANGIHDQLFEAMPNNQGLLPSLDMQPHINADADREEKNRSLCSDLWAKRHFLEWRKEQGLPSSNLEDLPLPELADCLTKFFRMVKKRNGSLFPSESLRAMFRAFCRILRSHYRKLQLQGQYDGPGVDLSRDSLFERARLACLEAMKYSKSHGGNVKRRKKPDEWIPAPEEDILCHPANQVTDPYGLLKRLCFYVIRKFHVHGHMELYYTTDVEFKRFGNGDGTATWEYDEKRAANHKRKSSFREPVSCSESDVVLCLDKYFFHAPPKASASEPRQLFLAPIGKPESNVWYRNQIMNLKTLRGWYRYMGPMPGRADSDPHLSSSMSQMDVLYHDSDPDHNLDAAVSSAAYLTTPREFQDSGSFERNGGGGVVPMGLGLGCGGDEEHYDGFDASINDDLSDNERY